MDPKTGKMDLSWCSDIRKDADMIIFMREDEERTVKPARAGDPGRYCVTLDMDKRREGQKDIYLPVWFRKEWQRFEPWEDGGYE